MRTLVLFIFIVAIQAYPNYQ